MDGLLLPLILEYGYLLLFLVLIAGIIGFPIPDEGVLLFAGGLAAKGIMSFIPVMICSVLAVFLGSMINYQVAATFIQFRHNLLSKWRERALHLMVDYGIWAVPLSYFIPGVRMGVSYVAGIIPLDSRRYLFASFSGVLCWVGAYVFLGYCLFRHRY